MKLTYKDWKDLYDSADREYKAAERSMAVHKELRRLAEKRMKNAEKEQISGDTDKGTGRTVEMDDTTNST